MYQGKHGNHDRGRAPRRPRSRRTLLAALALVLVLGLAIGGTVAYLFESTPSITNTFTPGGTTPGIEEKVENGVKNSIVIENKGNVDAYIRVMLVGNTVDDNGNITGGFDVTVSTLGTNWVKHTDGYYYYTKPVAGNGTTDDLLATGQTITVGENQTVTVLAQSIQSAPEKAVGEAWGVKISENSVTAYTEGGNA